MVQDISSPAKREQSSPKKATGMASIIGSRGENLFHTQFWNVTDGAGHGTPIKIIGTPVPPGAQKMSLLSIGRVTKLRLVTL